MTRESVVKKFKFASNTTASAIKKGYPRKEIKCPSCGKVLSEADFDNMEYVLTGSGTEKFFCSKECCHI